MGRKGGHVLPSTEDRSSDGKKLRVASAPRRGWLWTFLTLNLMAIVSFIFGSAMYFPSTLTEESLVEQSLKQGDALTLVKKEEQRQHMRYDRSKSEWTEEEDEDPERQLLLSDQNQQQQESVTTEDHVGEETIAPTQSDDTPTSSLPPPSLSLSPSLSPLPSPASVVPTLPPTVADLLARMHSPQPSEAPQPIDSGAPQEFVPTQTIAIIASQPSETQPQSQLPPESQAPPMHGTAGLELQSNLKLWLKADAGVQVENAVECDSGNAFGSACEVQGWQSQGASSSFSLPQLFRPVGQKPLWIPNTQNDLPVLYLSCPLVNREIVLHELMTFFFVLSPAAVEAGDTYKGQKFFGNAPYGQFLLHGGKPAFFTSGGLHEFNQDMVNGEFGVITYRLHSNKVEIRLNQQPWQSTADDATYAVRMSGNLHLSLGNVKELCDTNAFQGRMAEILVYDTILSDTQVELVETYLRHKWWGLDQPSRPIAAPNGYEQTTRSTTAPPEQPEQAPVILSDKQPEASSTAVTFDPENVFEWMPPEHLLTSSHKRMMAPTLLAQWKKSVNEKIESIRNFHLGGDVLRTFIRNRKDELIQLREELFG